MFIMRAPKEGETIKTISNVPVKILKKLGGGGQGFVYSVDYGGKKKILKWYKTVFCEEMMSKNVWVDSNKKPVSFIELQNISNPALRYREMSLIKAFYMNLWDNVQKKNMLMPRLGKEFVWPQDLSVWNPNQNLVAFGYIMDEIDTKVYQELTAYYRFNARFESRHAMLTACMNIVSAFDRLHSVGKSYQDLNNGNICVKADDGDIRILDNDNVTTNNVNLGVGGKDRYMAPEVVLGAAPNTYTDRFSMAIILFRILMGGQHPLEGVYSEEVADDRVKYGKDPVFIFDPTDRRNAPTPEKHENALRMWPQYPEYIHNLFQRVFGKEGIKHPEKRPIEKEWLKAFARLRGELVDCPKCKARRDSVPLFLSVTDTAVTCPKCLSKIPVPCRVAFDSGVFPIVPNHPVYECQIDPVVADFSKQALVLEVDKASGKTYFKNPGDPATSWDVLYPNGTAKKVPGKTKTEFVMGMKIKIRTHIGEVKR